MIAAKEAKKLSDGYNENIKKELDHIQALILAETSKGKYVLRIEEGDFTSSLRPTVEEKLRSLGYHITGGLKEINYAVDRQWMLISWGGE